MAARELIARYRGDGESRHSDRDPKWRAVTEAIPIGNRLQRSGIDRDRYWTGIDRTVGFRRYGSIRGIADGDARTSRGDCHLVPRSGTEGRDGGRRGRKIDYVGRVGDGAVDKGGLVGNRGKCGAIGNAYGTGVECAVRFRGRAAVSRVADSRTRGC